MHYNKRDPDTYFFEKKKKLQKGKVDITIELTPSCYEFIPIYLKKIFLCIFPFIGHRC